MVFEGLSIVFEAFAKSPGMAVGQVRKQGSLLGMKTVPPWRSEGLNARCSGHLSLDMDMFCQVLSHSR